MKFMVSIGANPILEFKMRKNSPLVANAYPLSGENPILKAKRLCFDSCKERTNRVSYPINPHTYIPLLYKIDLVVKDLLLENL